MSGSLELTERTWTSEQSVHLESITLMERNSRTFVLRCTVVRDSYDRQSYATCEVLNVKSTSGVGWAPLCSTPYPLMKSLRCSYVNPNWQMLQADAHDLLIQASALLGNAT